VTPDRLPLPEGAGFALPLRRTRLLRLGLAAALALASAAALAAALALRPAKPTLLPPGTSGVIVLDVSSSIGARTHRQIAHTLAAAGQTRDRYGLVLFSDTAYEALPPGTPATELQRYERLFRPLPEEDRGPGSDGLIPIGEPDEEIDEELVIGAGSARFPASPWRADFSAGTRISAGLRLAREILRRDGLDDGSVLLVSDLDDDQVDVPSLTQTLLQFRVDGVPLRVVALSPDPRNRTLFARLLGDPDAIRSAPVRAAELDERLQPYDRSRAPVWLAAAAAVLLLLLAANELSLARLSWRPPGAAEGAA
jgi:hypothetical protein